MPGLPVVFTEDDYRLVAEVVNVVRRADANLLNRLSGRLRSPQGGFMPPGWRIRFKNESSETVPTGGVMRITGGDATGGGFLKTAKPNATLQRLYLINIGDAIPPNKFGDGSYLTSLGSDFEENLVLYDTGNTPAYGESWGPQDGTWTLKKYRYGFTIMGGNTGTGAASRTIVVQHVVNEFWGQTDGVINKGSTGTVSVYDGNDADTSINVSDVKNKFANVAITKKVKAHWLGGSWYLDAAEC
jgi:hypothetical protein